MSLFTTAHRAMRTAGHRSFSSSSSQLRKVALLGASGGIGQPLALLLKMNDKITELALFDVRGTPGVAADIAHVNTKSTVRGLLADNDGLKKSLQGAEVVVIPAGVPRKPGMTRDDLFNTNASIVRDLAKSAADNCPKAHILIISNPVNSTVPIAAEVFKAKGVYDPKRLFGVTTLDVVRSSRFVSEIKNTDPADERVTVVGGHSGATIVPLLSQVPDLKLDDEKRAALVKRIQFGGDEVVKAKDGGGSATLSMAYAAAVFTNSLLRALDGETGVIEPAYIDVTSDKTVGADADQSITGGCEFFSLPVELGKSGVERVHAVGELDAKDKEVLAGAHADLRKNISAGVKFAKENMN